MPLVPPRRNINSLGQSLDERTSWTSKSFLNERDSCVLIANAYAQFFTTHRNRPWLAMPVRGLFHFALEASITRNRNRTCLKQRMFPFLVKSEDSDPLTTLKGLFSVGGWLSIRSALSRVDYNEPCTELYLKCEESDCTIYPAERFLNGKWWRIKSKWQVIGCNPWKW